MPRITVTLPEELLRELDTAAEELGQSRSQLVCRAVRELLQRRAQAVDEDLLAEGYREVAEHAAKAVLGFAALQAATLEEVLRSDE